MKLVEQSTFGILYSHNTFLQPYFHFSSGTQEDFGPQ